MEPPAVVVKLGGSVLTRKRGDARFRPKVATRLAAELAEAAPPSLVLLHGAGSFGHPGARRFGLATAPPLGRGDAKRARGAAIVSAEVRRLHALLVRCLLDAGANPVSVPAQVVASNRAGELVRLDAEPFRRALARGVLPVSFGDVVPDEEWGFSILSADTIAVELVRQLPARRLVFVSDVDGVWDPEARGPLPHRIAPRVSPGLLAALRPTPAAPDVTGGIRTKVAAMLAAAGAGADAGLISGLRHGALSAALRGDSVYGSWCEPEPH